ncbi:MAG: hypothetical protein RLZZ524_2344 [Pseudomonadota bacterium]
MWYNGFAIEVMANNLEIEMNGTFFFLWLNDTTPDRYYWDQSIQNWTTDFSKATQFATQQEARDEAVYAARTTKAEVIVQPMLRQTA